MANEKIVGKRNKKNNVPEARALKSFAWVPALKRHSIHVNRREKSITISEVRIKGRRIPFVFLEKKQIRMAMP